MILHAISFSALADEASANTEREQLFLTLSHSIQNDNVKIDVYSNKVSFCALMFALIYDCEVFSLENAQIGINNAEFDLSYFDENGKTVFLIDGTSNFVPDNDPIVSFIFSVDENISGEFDFSLLPSAKAAACRISNDEIENVNANGDNLQIRLEDSTKSCNLEIIDLEISDEDLTIYGMICGSVGFSVGYEVTFLYLYGKDPIIFIISQAISPSDTEIIQKDKFDFSITVPVNFENVYCIKVQPFSCFRNGSVYSSNSNYYFLK